MTFFEILFGTIILCSLGNRLTAARRQRSLPAPVWERCSLTEDIYAAARAEGLDPDWEMRNMGQGAVHTMIAKGVLACSVCEEPVFPEDNFCTGCGGMVRGKGKARSDDELPHPLL